MRRRNFLALAASAPLAAALPARRVGKPEIVYKSPGPHPNGLQATADGLWIMDQGNNRVYLVRYEDGRSCANLIRRQTRPAGLHSMAKLCGWRPLTIV